ncbi:MAG TPA: permease [Anaerolineae bacterium]|nr:permease [Anaerolineae bacterium]
MTANATFILTFIGDHLLAIWPYLLLSIPLAVIINLSGASKYLKHAFNQRPLLAILLATTLGAFSPFCSCTVIPLIATLLLSGVPLAPVVSFWIASPSMDPEIFLLTVALLGWPLALARLISTLLISLGAGYLTHWLWHRGWLGTNILRPAITAANTPTAPTITLNTMIAAARRFLSPSPTPTPVTMATTNSYTPSPSAIPLAVTTAPPRTSPAPANISLAVTTMPIHTLTTDSSSTCCTPTKPASTTTCSDTACATTATTTSCCSTSTNAPPPSLRTKILTETWAATKLIVKLMTLAFLLEALILLFVPQEWIISLLGTQNPLAIPAATLLGIPIYTSNLTALPLISGLLNQGMSPAAALAFLIAGPTTTLPAMSAVWLLVRPRIFALYIAIALFGSLSAAFIYQLII